MSGFSINVVTQSGNLTSDPELRSLASGTSVCRLRIAVNERFKNSATGEWDDRANYFDWTVWGGMGEWCAENLSKGDGVALSGRAKWREWEQEVEGKTVKRQAVDFTADSVVPQRSGGGGSGRTQRQAEQAVEDPFVPRTDAGTDGFAPAPGGEFTLAREPMPAAAGADDDIPF